VLSHNVWYCTNVVWTDLAESPLPRAMSVIVGPPPDHGGETQEQVSGRDLRVGVKHGSHFFQKGVHVLLGRLGQIRAVVFPDRLSEQVESLVDMGDVGLLGRERQPVRLEPLGQSGASLLRSFPAFALPTASARSGWARFASR
jgi:hypothetical protein